MRFSQIDTLLIIVSTLTAAIFIGGFGHVLHEEFDLWKLRRSK